MQSIDDLRIKTSRLLLRPYEIGDEEAVFSVISKREIYETTLLIPHPYPRESVVYWIHLTRKNIERKIAYELGSFHQETGKYIGNCGIANLSFQNNSGELAYFIDPNEWHKGYGTEAVKQILSFGFNVLQLERIIGRCMSHNIGSQKVLEKNGLQFEGVARHEVRKEEQYRDILRYAILRADYRQ